MPDIKKAIAGNNGFKDLIKRLQTRDTQYNTVGKQGNSEKSAIDYLTEKPQDVRLKNVPGDTNTRHNVKQNIGGKVENTQPPAMRGFFMPATQPGDCNKLSGVARNKIPPSGNTCSASYVALNGSRQLLNCPHVKQNIEEYAMQGTNQGIATPVASSQVCNPSVAQEQALINALRAYCLIPTSTLLDALIQAKQERATNGKANAYAVLLEQFHKAILPAFFAECGGNLSEISRLLGIHRETVRLYAALADVNAASVGGAA